jgi:dsDNA-specific endonuclease/ATPase MutS2
MREFRTGDRVQLIDELTEGVVLEVGPQSLRLKTEDGFEILVAMTEVVHLPGSTSLLTEVPDHARSLKEERTPGKRRISGARKERQNPPLVVDLHIEKLLTDTRGMTTFDILNYQMESARGQLEFALRKRIQRVVFIHGVGEGILKEELRTLFRRYEGLKVRDADYRKYGMGATEVYIPQSNFL